MTPTASRDPQLVRRDVNARYHRLIKKFEGATDTPLIFKTSFKLEGEPVVLSPVDALYTLRGTGMDVLVLDSSFVRKGA